MVWGGRDPTLRVKPTLPAMTRLAETGHLEQATRRQLEASYRFLRQVEHRLQMVNDRQTHDLPEQSAEMDRIARFMAYPDAPAFARDFLRHVGVVRTNYRTVFEHVPDQPGPDLPGTQPAGPELDFRGDDPEPAATVAALNGLGYHDTKRIVSAVRRWLTGRVRALRSSRARDLMTTMVPSILVTLGRQAEPGRGVQPVRPLHQRAAGRRAADVAVPAQSPMLLDRIAPCSGPRRCWRNISRAIRVRWKAC